MRPAPCWSSGAERMERQKQKEDHMKRLSEKLQKMMMAVTFAEAGEHETAREIMREGVKTDRTRPSKRIEKTMRASSPPRQ